MKTKASCMSWGMALPTLTNDDIVGTFFNQTLQACNGKLHGPWKDGSASVEYFGNAIPLVLRAPATRFV
jgi:hypothetical protein